MERVTVRAFQEVSFQRSPYTNYMHWRRTHREYAETLVPGDTVMLLSRMRKRLVFVIGFHRVQTPDGRWDVTFSYREAIIDSTTFDPYMMHEYGKRAGLNILWHKDLGDRLKWFTGEYLDPELKFRASEKMIEKARLRLVK